MRKMNLLKLISLILCLVMLISLASCAASGGMNNAADGGYYGGMDGSAMAPEGELGDT